MRKTNAGIEKSSYIKIAAITVVLILLIAVGLVLLHRWEDNRGKFPEHEVEGTTIEYQGKKYALSENVETFLVLGLDKFEGEGMTDSYNNDKQADFLMLFVFDNDTKKCTAIQINRDTMVAVNVLGVAGNKVDTLTRQIALAHTYGNGRDVSCRNTADSVSSLLKGVKVNHYLSVMMDAVPIFNDLVGGVEVVVLHDFTGIDDTLVKGETVTLMGEQALRYVRTRNGLEDSTNSTRMERQQQYINALYQATQKCIADNDEFIVDASLTMSDYTVSDRSVTQLQALAEKFNQYEFLGIQGIAGESQMGEEYIEFYPDENALMELVVRLFYETVK
jgi:LCP family protein required for cell wall assembly